MIRDYVALDLETSGLNPSENQIIEIGMAKVCDGEITETYSRLLNPKEKLSQRIVELTGITDEMVAGQPHVSEVIDEIVSLSGICRFWDIILYLTILFEKSVCESWDSF